MDFLELFEYLVTALIFTWIGYRWASQKYELQAKQVINATMDRLIAQRYIRTRGSGENLELLTWDYDETQETQN